MKAALKKIIQKFTHSFIPRAWYKYTPHGSSLFLDLKQLPKSFELNTFFDVGANIGQTANEWSIWFPKTTYHCFEPVSKTYKELKQNTKKIASIKYHPFALSDTNGHTEINLFEFSTNNSLKLHDTDKSKVVAKEKIELKTLSDFCDAENISQIDFLKIDTEGNDLQVLQGASKLLENHKITFIQVEAGMNPFNDRHVPFTKLKDFLESTGYVLFGLYDQQLEWTGEKRLRFTNPVFVSSKATFTQ